MVSDKRTNGRRQGDGEDALKSVAGLILTGRDRVRGKRQRPRYSYSWLRDQEGVKAQPPHVYRRVREVETVLADTYRGRLLPDDDAGREDLFIMAQHIRGLGGNVAQHVENFARMWAPWMPAAEARALAEDVIARPRKWKADSMAKELGVTMERRCRLGLSTIGASDVSAKERKRLARKIHAESKAAARLAAGAKPHSESAERTKPWDAEGISRRTYYRRQAAGSGTGGTDSADQGVKVAGRNSANRSEPSGASLGPP